MLDWCLPPSASFGDDHDGFDVVMASEVLYLSTFYHEIAAVFKALILSRKGLGSSWEPHAKCRSLLMRFAEI